MRSCRRELATKGNLDGAEGGISYSLLSAVPRPLGYNFLKSPRPTAGAHGCAEAVLLFNKLSDITHNPVL